MIKNKCKYYFFQIYEILEEDELIIVYLQNIKKFLHNLLILNYSLSKFLKMESILISYYIKIINSINYILKKMNQH